MAFDTPNTLYWQEKQPIIIMACSTRGTNAIRKRYALKEAFTIYLYITKTVPATCSLLNAKELNFIFPEYDY